MSDREITNPRLDSQEGRLVIVFDVNCKECNTKYEGVQGRVLPEGNLYYLCDCGRTYTRRYSLKINLEGESAVERIVALASHLSEDKKPAPDSRNIIILNPENRE